MKHNYTTREIYQIGYSLIRWIEWEHGDIAQGAWIAYKEKYPQMAERVQNSFDASNMEDRVSLFKRIKNRLDEKQHLEFELQCKRAIVQQLYSRVTEFEIVLEAKGFHHESDPAILLP